MLKASTFLTEYSKINDDNVTFATRPNFRAQY